MGIIERTAEYARQELEKAEGGHDWWHVYRVWQMTKRIAQGEEVDGEVAELGALLHDIADAKFHNGDETVGPKKAREFLVGQGLKDELIDRVVEIIENISFRKELSGDIKKINPELSVVKDADRLDAMGAIGIARTFNYGGHKGRELYNPEQPPRQELTMEDYKTKETTAINHFYEKMLKLKDMMNTVTGRSIAEGRHKYMEEYLEEFFGEWEGRK